MACSAAPRGDQASGAASAATGTSELDLDYALPRACTVTAYESATAPQQFSVGDYLVASAQDTTPGAVPLTRFVSLGADGKPTQVRFGVYFRHDGEAHASLLTPYSPMPVASQDATSITFSTPPLFAQDGVSTFTITASDGPEGDVTVDFSETVHGHPSRTISFACSAPDDAGAVDDDADASAPSSDEVDGDTDADS